MTKLLITENLITNKQDFIKLSNISDGVEFITFNEFLSTTTLSLFEDYSKKFVFDKFVNFRDLSKSDYDFSLDYIFQIKKSSLSKFSEVSSHIEIIESLKKGKDKFFPWDLSNIIFSQKESLSNEIINEFCQNEYVFQQFLSYLNKELLRINLLFDNEEESVSLLLDEKTDFKYELANRRLSNISRDNLNQSFHQLNKIERLINESDFNHENNKRFIVGIKKLLEF